MWIFTSDSFLSVVAYRKARDPKQKAVQKRHPGVDLDAEMLLVRGRFKGDIEKVFPGAIVRETNRRADYRFRAVVPKREVGYAIACQVGSIDYTNFKSSVREHPRHRVLMDLWSTLHRAQNDQARPPRPRKRKSTGKDVWDDPEPPTWDRKVPVRHDSPPTALLDLGDPRSLVDLPTGADDVERCECGAWVPLDQSVCLECGQTRMEGL